MLRRRLRAGLALGDRRLVEDAEPHPLDARRPERLRERQREGDPRAAGGAPSAQMRPPWASTRPRAIARPSPAPPVRAGSLRQKRSNIRRAASGVMPLPVSSTLTVTWSPAASTSTAIGAVGRRVLQRVREEVQEDPLDLVGRAADGRRVGELPVELHSACPRLGLDAADAPLHDRRDRDHLQLVVRARPRRSAPARTGRRRASRAAAHAPAAAPGTPRARRARRRSPPASPGSMRPASAGRGSPRRPGRAARRTGSRARTPSR